MTKSLVASTPVKVLDVASVTPHTKSKMGGLSTQKPRRALGDLSHAKLNTRQTPLAPPSAQRSTVKGAGAGLGSSRKGSKPTAVRVLVMEDPSVEEERAETGAGGRGVDEMLCTTNKHLDADDDVYTQVMRKSALAAKRSAIEDSLPPQSILSAEDFDFDFAVSDCYASSAANVDVDVGMGMDMDMGMDDSAMEPISMGPLGLGDDIDDIF